MKNILILGAGLSSSSLIKYLLDNSTEHNWKIRIGDMSKETAEKKINNHPNGAGFKFDVNNETQREKEIQQADVVISMLPARMHYLVANDCVRFSKHMVTASYVSPEVRKLDKEAKEKGLLLLNEIGVDPGIDHMSAMKVIDEIRNRKGELLSFKSSTGGLVAPKYDNNPWNYKFTWNPRNVVLAGQGTSKYIKKGRYKYIPYQQLFTRLETTEVLNVGEFEIYPNRDSLQYREIYGLEGIPTIFRGTMRRPGYCKTWNILVQIGLTDDTYIIEDSENMTYREFVNSYFKYETGITVEEKVARRFNLDEDSFTLYKLRWLGLFKDEKIGLVKATPAQILQHILEEKWALAPEDRDMIVMQHKFRYKLNGKKYGITSSLVVIGEDTTHTAMSITVGIPVAIATKLLLTGKIQATGVQIPVTKKIYEPVLKELEAYGIKFIEEEYEIND